MHAIEWLGAAVGALTLAWAVTSAVVWTLVKAVRGWVVMGTEMRHLAQDLADIVKRTDAAHLQLAQQAAEDRRSTDRRLRWLEENVWARPRARERWPGNERLSRLAVILPGP